MVSATGITQFFLSYFESYKSQSEIWIFILDSFISVFKGWCRAEDTWHGKGGKKVWILCFQNIFKTIVRNMDTCIEYFYATKVIDLGCLILNLGKFMLSEELIIKCMEASNGKSDRKVFRLIYESNTTLTKPSIIEFAYTVATKLYEAGDSSETLQDWNNFVMRCVPELVSHAKFESLNWRISKLEECDKGNVQKRLCSENEFNLCKRLKKD